MEDATQKRDRLFEEARRDVVEHGKKTGNERLVLLDAKTGETLDAGNGTINNLILTDAMMALINDSNNAVRLIHNHPKSLSFSMEDLVIASQPGADSIEAVGHDGAWYKARLKINNSVLLEEKLMGINTEVMNCLGQLVSSKKITLDSAGGIYHHVVNLILAKSGSMDYKYQLSTSKARMWITFETEFNAIVDEVVTKLVSI